MAPTLDPLLREVAEIAREAGRAILSHAHDRVGVRQKADNSPVSDADHASHAIICARLAALEPGLPILSEESDPGTDQGRLGWARYWLVDPLDGTREYLRGSPEFTVNIALVEGSVAALGVVHAPAVDGVIHMARRGGPAWRQQAGEPPEVIRTRKADPSRLVVAVSRSRSGPRTQALLARLPGAIPLSMGSALKFGLVAEGKADVSVRFGTTMEWDTAAPQCVVEAAGGALLDLDGRPLLLSKDNLENPAMICLGDPTLDWKRWRI